MIKDRTTADVHTTGAHCRKRQSVLPPFYACIPLDLVYSFPLIFLSKHLLKRDIEEKYGAVSSCAVSVGCPQWEVDEKIDTPFKGKQTGIKCFIV